MKNEEFATALRIIFLTQTTSRQNKKQQKNKKNNKNPFLLFMSFTHSFSICLSEIPSKLALTASHIENSLTA